MPTCLPGVLCVVGVVASVWHLVTGLTASNLGLVRLGLPGHEDVQFDRTGDHLVFSWDQGSLPDVTVSLHIETVGHEDSNPSEPPVRVEALTGAVHPGIGNRTGEAVGVIHVMEPGTYRVRAEVIQGKAYDGTKVAIGHEAPMDSTLRALAIMAFTFGASGALQAFRTG